MQQNYYQLSKQLKINSETITAKLLSIQHDSQFVEHIFSNFPPQTPKFANLRCGLWYHPTFTDTCYFKSTDGHVFQWSFSIKRLNLNVLNALITHGVSIIVDSTKRGKIFPDALSKTIPIWAASWNEIVFKNGKISCPEEIPTEEVDLVQQKLPQFALSLINSGIDPLNSYKLKKPIKCMWMEPNDINIHKLWTVQEIESLDFYPLILVTASDSKRDEKTFGWKYIQGAGDDHQEWSKGLTPELFYKWKTEILQDERFIEDIVDSNCDKDVHNLMRNMSGIVEIGQTGLFIGSYEAKVESDIFRIYCGYCDKAENDEDAKWYDIKDNKKMKSLERNLNHVLKFVLTILEKKMKIAFLCPTGTSEAVVVCIAVLAAYFDKDHVFVGSGKDEKVTKESLRQLNGFISTFVNAANPSRDLMKQLNRYFL